MTEESSAVDSDSSNNDADPNAPSDDAPASSGAEAVNEDPLAVAQAEAARFKDQLLRTAADFDNFRKRMRREVGDAERKGRDDLLKDLLPVFDNLERAAQHAQSAGSNPDGDWKGLADGIDLVIRQFRDTLGRLGIERVVSLGVPFDPSVHEAIQHLETSEFAPGCIAAEVQAGYKQAERLIRPALVVVAKAPAAAEPAEGSSNDAN